MGVSSLHSRPLNSALGGDIWYVSSSEREKGGGRKSYMDEQDDRIARILVGTDAEDADEDDLWKSPETIKRYADYIRENIEIPCMLTGIQDFPWEERYVFGHGSSREYAKLKKSNPSYHDIFELINIDEHEDEDDRVFVKERRRDDGKEFIIGLDWLEATDKTSKNYELLNDYAVWHANY